MGVARYWNDDAHHAIEVYEKVLSIIGIWPLSAGDLKSIVRCILAMLIQVSYEKIIIRLTERSHEVRRTVSFHPCPPFPAIPFPACPESTCLLYFNRSVQAPVRL